MRSKAGTGDPPAVRDALGRLADEVIACRRCPRLVAWREQVARDKRRAFRDQEYWGRPVPGFGDPRAWLLVVGLAPAAHGANRTGRMFTGDRSGDFLYAALHRAGWASQAESRHRHDGLELDGVYITTPCRCAPPANKPRPCELAACRPFFEREILLLANVRVVLALGAIGFSAYLEFARSAGALDANRGQPRPRFAHGAVVPLPRLGHGQHLLGSYHVSQKNTQTGRLTPAMFDAILRRAALLRAAPTAAPGRHAAPDVAAPRPAPQPPRRSDRRSGSRPAGPAS